MSELVIQGNFEIANIIFSKIVLGIVECVIENEQINNFIDSVNIKKKNVVTNFNGITTTISPKQISSVPEKFANFTMSVEFDDTHSTINFQCVNPTHDFFPCSVNPSKFSSDGTATISIFIPQEIGNDQFYFSLYGRNIDSNEIMTYDSLYLNVIPSIKNKNPIPIIIHSSDTSIDNKNTILFDSSYSFDPDGDKIIKHIWDFGDGFTSNDMNVSHRYENVGDYLIQLTVIDEKNNFSEETKLISVSENTNTLFP